MSERTALDRYFGWEVRRVELALVTAIALAGFFASALLSGGGMTALGIALLSGCAAGLLLKGNVDALRGREPESWLAFVGLGYLFLGAFAFLNGTAVAAVSLSVISLPPIIGVVIGALLGAIVVARGIWFVSVTL